MSARPKLLESVARLLPKSRVVRALGIVVLAGAAAGVVLVPALPAPGDDALVLPEVTLLGEVLAPGEGGVKRALERVRRYGAGRFRLEVPGQPAREVYLGKLGAVIDKAHLADLVRDARDATSPTVRLWRKGGATARLTLPVPVTLDRALALPALLELKDELDRLPVDARLDLEKRELVKEVIGRELDVDATLGSIEQALGRGEPAAKVVFLERKPKRIASELGSVAFDEVLGYFETRYDRSQRYEARTFNLRLAASKLDGHVLLPGETFDFNGVVGARDEANGYKVAKVIAEGELVDGLGGGTCQISGTLHGAAFFAGLDIVERYPHTRPSSYIKMGLDATVVYPTINFRIRNPFTFPVVLHQTVKNGVVRAEILGPHRSRTVTLIRRVLDSIPYEEVERPDKTLPAGVRVLGQRGVAGFKLRRYRLVREGLHATRERWDDVYPPTTQIVRLGTGESVDTTKKPEDDPHPEYLADELLIVTQGPDDDAGAGAGERGGVTIENREPGKFGEPGWTKNLGMPFWENKAGPPEEPPDQDATSRKKKGKA
jgi:vancomycin resistance protein YoaR